MASTSSFSPSSSKESSALNFSPELRRQYRNLNFSVFMRYWFYSYYAVFQPLYLVQTLQLWQLFVNWSLSPILSLVIQNYWSKRVDETQRIKKYIIASSLVIAIVSVYTIYVNSFWMLLVITILLSVSPPGDLLANVLVYRLSDRVTSNIKDPVEKKFHNINIYAHYRRYGSIGWAIGLPIMGFVINVVGLRSGINFWICALGMVVTSIWFKYAINEKAILTPQDRTEEAAENSVAFPKKRKQVQLSLWQKYRALFSNQIYSVFIFASLLYYIAYASTNQVQGLFYSLISQGDYFKLVWVYSFAALAEWPVMAIVARQVRKIGWEKMITLVYVLDGIRLTILPLIFILNGDIFWGYLLQLYSGALFGLTWPTTTFGLYISLPDDQKALGQSFVGTVNSIGASLGGLMGALISLSISDQHLVYYYLHWIAGSIAILSGILLYYFKRKMNRKAG